MLQWHSFKSFKSLRKSYRLKSPPFPLKPHPFLQTGPHPATYPSTPTTPPNLHAWELPICHARPALHAHLYTCPICADDRCNVRHTDTYELKTSTHCTCLLLYTSLKRATERQLAFSSPFSNISIDREVDVSTSLTGRDRRTPSGISDTVSSVAEFKWKH